MYEIFEDDNGKIFETGNILYADLNLRGQKDLYGNALEITEVGRVDEIASAASLLMGQANEGLPVILVRGIPETSKVNNVKSILRDKSEDLFR